MTEPVLYAERGSSWWPVLWGPAFALLGWGVELLSPGRVQPGLWLFVAAALGVATLVWTHGRRRVCSVLLTPEQLSQGREQLDVSRIAAVREVGTPVGARVLGGSMTVPKGRAEVPVRLVDDRVVLAWAADPEALRAALVRLLE